MNEIADQIAPADSSRAKDTFRDDTDRFAILIGALVFALPLMICLLYVFLWLPLVKALKPRLENNWRDASIPLNSDCTKRNQG